jgi:hypothetical protein
LVVVAEPTRMGIVCQQRTNWGRSNTSWGRSNTSNWSFTFGQKSLILSVMQIVLDTESLSDTVNDRRGRERERSDCKHMSTRRFWVRVNHVYSTCIVCNQCLHLLCTPPRPPPRATRPLRDPTKRLLRPCMPCQSHDRQITVS